MSSTGSPNIAYDYLTPSGVIVPDTSQIQSDVISEYESAFEDPTLNMNPETPQGTLGVTEIACRAAMVANNAAVANQINPNQAAGIFLQAICALTGLTIPVSTPSTIAGVTVSGQPNTPLPAGSIAELQDSEGNHTGIFFETVEAVNFGLTGSTTVDFEAQEDGPTAAAPGQLKFVVSDVLGWETVYNAASAVPGDLAPSDVQLRQLRNNTLAGQGSSLDEAVISAVQKVPGVVINGVAFRQNILHTNQTINGIPLLPNSIWVCVQGGDNTAVANAIRCAKSGGCNYTGYQNSVTVNLTDPYSGQLCPVTFDRPSSVAIQVAITVVLPNTSYTANDVVQAILDYAAGEVSGQAGFVLSQSVAPFDIAGGVVQEIPGIKVKNLMVCQLGGTLSTNLIPLTLNQVATLSANNINVTIATS
jgi:hypothetical protein